MTNKKIHVIFITILIIGSGYTNSTAQINETNMLEECTVGVAAGKATVDGRPLLWKTRDMTAPNNEILYNTFYKYSFISVVNAGSYISWMGVNEKGFAIMNSQSGDLKPGKSGLHNGTIMTYALGTCATVEDFIHLLDSTNVTERTTTANLGVIDAAGGAAIFETSGTEYWKFDANDPQVAPNGYVLRANFAFNGGGKGGKERYERTEELVGDFFKGDSLSYKSILRHQMRDFVDKDNKKIDLPFTQQWTDESQAGYIDCNKSICRPTSVSAAVFHGVLPDEPAILTTMWTILGQPASGIAVPYWPVGKTPDETDGKYTAPLCDAANQIRSLLFDQPDLKNFIDSYKLRDENGNGLWKMTFAAEDSIISATTPIMEKWRATTPSTQEILHTETTLAKYALRKLKRAYRKLIQTP